MFTKKNKKVDSLELNGSEMRELSGKELSSVNGAGSGVIIIQGSISKKHKQISIGCQWQL
ncbi:hypothetical protein B6D12_09790 [Gilliamella apicola]|uniref:hypothetical protein n=1 Tax=Gilliamella apicola TaxID=1196095 RepID=UPI000A331EE8|nr:hypothetical protein [Gilliamella apicola]OTP88768.1 hypothetical protein B5S41_08725 [Gilliamella apicola]OTP97029.1 hypothetical protein B6D05_02625 [Gilliamella apicola]OTQ04769.1 hypothetical protein B6D12_09790 [Gilliamella apicola]OTQ19100.1 hypothetical protein B6D15_03070 [Gilliamella apicola]OTQ21332.1 hypothetical protein B6D16_01685 [Gilliamella apicola]